MYFDSAVELGGLLDQCGGYRGLNAGGGQFANSFTDCHADCYSKPGCVQ